MVRRGHNILNILPDAARWRGRTVGLYGGSFNPVHKGHSHVATEALKRLDIDAVWMMVSPGNPLKVTGSEKMVSAEARLSHTRTTLRPSKHIYVSDIETRLGTRYTADTLQAMTRLMPETRFVWIMGADNMAGFFRWKHWQQILNSVPIAIFDRPGYTIPGLSSRLAHRIRHARVAPSQLLKETRRPAWTFLTIPRHPGSATLIRSQLGQIWTEGRIERTRT